MAVKIKKGDALGLLNLTPIIDVVFNLLIFFLVATTFADDEEQRLDVVLPQASNALPVTSTPRELTININRQGRFFLGSRPVTVGELLDALRQSATDNPVRQSVLIRADRTTPWQFVVTAMDKCNEAGIRNYRVSALDTQGKSR